MENTTPNQWLNLVLSQDTHLETWIEAFLVDRKAQNMAKGTLHFYITKLKVFTNFCEKQQVTQITQIDPNLIRQYLFYLESLGHNPGGIHGFYRTLKTFLRWWEWEIEPEGWKNPINKVKAPKVAIEPLEPVNINDVKAMIDVCPKNTLIGLRDKAIMLFLLDTGVRASELLSVNLGDINFISGEILIRKGKGRKPRYVYIGNKTKKAIRAYLKARNDNNLSLWITNTQDTLTYWGLKSTIRTRASKANVPTPSTHSFRRWFALTCLRSETNVYSIQELMGHTDLQVLRRYLKETNHDLMKAHQKASPVDRIG